MTPTQCKGAIESSQDFSCDSYNRFWVNICYLDFEFTMAIILLLTLLVWGVEWAQSGGFPQGVSCSYSQPMDSAGIL